jgi:hypothetical protein
MAQLAGNDANPPANNADLIAKYIPSEAVAVYIGALGILAPAAQATPFEIHAVRFICFGAGFAMALILAFASLDKAGISSAQEVRRRRIVVAALAAFAFTLYAAAMPNFFVEGTLLTIAFTQWATVAAIVVATILPLLAKLLGVRLQTRWQDHRLPKAAPAAPVAPAPPAPPVAPAPPAPPVAPAPPAPPAPPAAGE